jgi:mono/diheme cytochrome c family protein
MTWCTRIACTALFLFAVTAGVAAAEPQSQAKDLKHGEYLVNAGGCGDCHTPMKMGAAGPEPDMAHRLSGHPAALIMPPPPKMPEGPWLGSFSATMTAWAGPWGVSFTANITPDEATGVGLWTPQIFLDTIHKGKHMGKGRDILPPMPIPAMQNLTDADLKAIFGYLKSIPAVANQVPEPVPPQGADAH